MRTILAQADGQMVSTVSAIVLLPCSNACDTSADHLRMQEAHEYFLWGSTEHAVDCVSSALYDLPTRKSTRVPEPPELECIAWKKRLYEASRTSPLHRTDPPQPHRPRAPCISITTSSVPRLFILLCSYMRSCFFRTAHYTPLACHAARCEWLHTISNSNA